MKPGMLVSTNVKALDGTMMLFIEPLKDGQSVIWDSKTRIVGRITAKHLALVIAIRDQWALVCIPGCVGWCRVQLLVEEK